MNKMEKIIKFDELPIEILLNIFNKLSANELLNVSQVNKRLSIISNDNILWKTKLLADMQKWKIFDSETYPKNLNLSSPELNYFKNLYLDCYPETRDYYKKTKKYQETNSVEDSNFIKSSSANNLTLSFLSIPNPGVLINQIKGFLNKNIFENNKQLKFVMFGPGLETTTSCLVTNILWKSEFKAIGMVPGKDGYGSGIKLKLYDYKPFNLTILYTNVSKVRANNNNHDIKENRLIKRIRNESLCLNEYELLPQVSEASTDATGFIYVIDNEHLEKNLHNTELIENYKLELQILMNCVEKNLPLLILSCKSNTEDRKSKLCCSEVVKLLDLINLNREWQIRDCEIIQEKMLDVILGFEWLLKSF